VSRRRAYAVLALVCAVPRLAALLHERGAITAAFTEKSDLFAQVFVQHGTFGLVPGEPSAYTQPLYAWFLIPIYWIFGRGWLSIGLAQIAVAIAVVWLVYEIGRRLLGTRAGLAAAALATLNPYLVWHDVHVNREILDQLCAAALVLLTLVVADRYSAKLAALLGVITGVAILGNTRLVFVPVLCAAYLVWRLPRPRPAILAAVLVLVGAGVAVSPWLVRNKATLGCWAITTDARAMWKANNVQTYGLLTHGQWIDDFKPPFPRQKGPHHWYTPDDVRGYYDKGLTSFQLHYYPDECSQMRFFEHLTVEYWKQHPGQKAKLAALSAKLLWQPSVTETSGRPGAGQRLDIGRRVVEPAYMWAIYALAAIGLFLAPRAYVVLALLLLAYQTLAAMVFVGATRYRVAWDFLLVLLAGAALARGAEWLRARRAKASGV
jgi:4-amino-4-deoxy-L-arabinose transferase-like glycosyltransferase